SDCILITDMINNVTNCNNCSITINLNYQRKMIIGKKSYKLPASKAPIRQLKGYISYGENMRRSDWLTLYTFTTIALGDLQKYLAHVRKVSEEFWFVILM
ncbi:hypothetical protein L9F63_005596, partial [Diploptera punctata]